MEATQFGFFGETHAVEQKEKHTSLASRFVCPPFSVLDTKQGYWKERVLLWKNLGIQGEVGRDLNPGGNHRTDYGEDSQTGGYSATFGKNTDTAVSIFDPVLCEVAYSWFCPLGGHVLDPFAGGSVRGIVSSMLGRKYTGLDLSGRQVEANREQARDIVPGNEPTWIAGNSLHIDSLVQSPQKFDFLFSCPPYFDLEIYTDNPEDLSNKKTYTDFLIAYRQIIIKSVQLLKQDAFACFVVGDLRDKNGHYRNFPGDTIQAFLSAGTELYNEIVLLTAIGSLPIRAGKHFAAGRKVGKAHQNVLVFVKGDGIKAARKCEAL